MTKMTAAVIAIVLAASPALAHEITLEECKERCLIVLIASKTHAHDFQMREVSEAGKNVEQEERRMKARDPNFRGYNRAEREQRAKELRNRADDLGLGMTLTVSANYSGCKALCEHDAEQAAAKK